MYFVPQTGSTGDGVDVRVPWGVLPAVLLGHGAAVRGLWLPAQHRPVPALWPAADRLSLTQQGGWAFSSSFLLGSCLFTNKCDIFRHGEKVKRNK